MIWTENHRIGVVLSEGWSELGPPFKNVIYAHPNMTNPCGLTIFSNTGVPRASYLTSKFNQMYDSGCRFAVTMQDRDDTYLFQKAAPSSAMFGAGVGWISNNWTAGWPNMMNWPLLHGWLIADVHIDQSLGQYPDMEAAFTKHWAGKNLSAADALQTNLGFMPYAATAWNAVLATAHVLAEMFSSALPLYPDNPDFSAEFMEKLKNFKGMGAGVRIEFSKLGDGNIPYRVTNAISNTRGTRGTQAINSFRNIGIWYAHGNKSVFYPLSGLNATLHIQWPRSGPKPEDPTEALCPPGKHHVGSYWCEKCPIGTYASTAGETGPCPAPITSPSKPFTNPNPNPYSSMQEVLSRQVCSEVWSITVHQLPWLCLLWWRL